MFKIFNKHTLINKNTIEDIEDTLITADFDIDTTKQIINYIKALKINNNDLINQIPQIIKTVLIKKFPPINNGFTIVPNQINVFTFAGINGAGKTTSIAKIANLLKNNGNKVLLVPADLFRAGAVEQLTKWANELNIQLFTTTLVNPSPSTVAYAAIDYAKANNFNVILIDTSGRLDNNVALMNELTKVQNIIKKHNVLSTNIFVLDATLGSGTVNIVDNFTKYITLNAIILTKLDGIAKAGFVFKIINKYKIPIIFIGNGEKKEHLEPFNITSYINNLFD